MAVDKLVDSTQLNSDLTSVANAIRTKGGTSGSLAFPAGFVSAVQAIPTGTTPTGTKQISITQNGTTTEDVTAYASAEISVNVSGGGGYSLDDIAEKNITGSIVLNNATSVKIYAFYDCDGITDVSSDTVTQLIGGAFRSCSNLVSVTFPNCTELSGNDGVFYGCTKLKNVSMKALASHLPNFAFRDCSALEVLSLPNCLGVYTQVFTGDTSLTTLELGGSSGTLAASSLVNATALNTLILRQNGVKTLANINAFTNTPFASGGAGGTLYVPQALIADYQAATNWSTILGYANNQILPIEGSIYENAYADGTPIAA